MKNISVFSGFLAILAIACSQSSSPQFVPDTEEVSSDMVADVTGDIAEEAQLEEISEISSHEVDTPIEPDYIETPADTNGEAVQTDLEETPDEGLDVEPEVANEGLEECLPACEDKECGDDGCGGLCGICPEGTTCNEGKCDCIPQHHKDCCGMAVCWFDGCGNEGEKIVDCPYGCAAGVCLACIPNCEDKECGDDGCGGSCGECNEVSCDENLVWTTQECIEGKCVSNSVNCNDNNSCTRDYCDPENGCTHENNDGVICGPLSCSNGIVWTMPTCNGGVCNPAVVLSCDDMIDCTSDECGDEPMSCKNTLSPLTCFIDGVCRKDGEKNDQCQVCDPANPTAWSCLADTKCDDGNPKTIEDMCVTGQDGTCKCQGRFPNPDPCGEDLNPECYVADCVTQNGEAGECVYDITTGCKCQALPPPECKAAIDCLGRIWPLKCGGYWACVKGKCEPQCGDPCGNDVCENEAGEDWRSCAIDCPPPCKSNSNCAPANYCAKKVGDCGGYGVCLTKPIECPLVYKPICGCDGNTHQNACLAAKAGVSVWHEGECNGMECLENRDCLGKPWMLLCLGRWVCQEGLCEGECGMTCGDKVCNPDDGEETANCPEDCPPDPCDLKENPECKPVSCKTTDGSDGQCSKDVLSGCGCVALPPGECVNDSDCLSKQWPLFCGGHWDCVGGKCIAVCDKPCGNGSCEPAEGESMETCPEDCECMTQMDCLGREWPVDCVGHWTCSKSNKCEPTCETIWCGDGYCDAQSGEDAQSCPPDCYVDTCMLQIGPMCLPFKCKTKEGVLGKCGNKDVLCVCIAGFGACDSDYDCIGKKWPIRCYGHWDCSDGTCMPTCGKPCGDGVCDKDAGEDQFSCSADCPTRDTHCDDGTTPICDMKPPECNEYELLAFQNSCYVCVNPVTCKPWGEAGCNDDSDCEKEKWCNPCGTSSCPLCNDCLPACTNK